MLNVSERSVNTAKKVERHLLAIRLVFLDEAMFGGSRKSVGVIKTRITEPFITIEQKGVDAFRIANHMIFIAASNEASAVAADIGDRRWQIFEGTFSKLVGHSAIKMMRSAKKCSEVFIPWP